MSLASSLTTFNRNFPNHRDLDFIVDCNANGRCLVGDGDLQLSATATRHLEIQGLASSSLRNGDWEVTLTSKGIQSLDESLLAFEAL